MNNYTIYFNTIKEKKSTLFHFYSIGEEGGGHFGSAHEFISTRWQAFFPGYCHTG